MSARAWTTRAARAFSFIEVLVAVAIMATAILGVLGAFSVSIRAASRAQRQEQAAAIAQRELAQAAVLAAGQLQPKSGKEGGYAWKLTFQDAPLNLLRAEVVVQWQQRGRTESFTLAELLSPKKEE